ncbi:MAG: VCBS repeat-containing protein, partial [Candidatus Peribacteraceae bacterium]
MPGELLLMAQTIVHVRGFLTLSLGIALVCIVLAVEWNAVLNYWRIQRISLREVEWMHPRLPSGFEIISTNLLSLAFLLLSVQFIAVVYAMSFTLFASTTETNGTVSGVAADFDADGDMDYVAGNSNGVTPVDFDQYLNNGSFSFTHSAFTTNIYLRKVAAGDFNGDGRPDIVYVRQGGGTADLYKGTMGAATFVTQLIGIPYYFLDIALSDIDNDGDLDAVGPETGGHSVFLNDGHGNFTTAASTLGASGKIALADLNSDGYLDIAWALSLSVKTYINSGTGAFIPLSSVPTVATLQDVQTADFDGDGDIDVVSADDSNIIVWGNDGAGNLSALSSIPYGGGTSPGRMALGDMDNDGDTDVIVGGKDNLTGNKIFVNNGAGTLTLSSTQGEASDFTQDITAGDFDGDGDLDYIAGNSFGQVNRYYKNDQAATLPNTAPSAPNGLTVVRVTGGNGSGSVRLSWGSGSDTQ